MDLQKSNMTVLAQIVKLIPAKIIDSLAKKYKIQTRAFSPTSHVVTLLYEHLAHSLSLNDVCYSLQHHSGMLNEIRRCTPPTRNGLSYANRNRNADMAEELFWYVYNDLKESYPRFFKSNRSYPGLPHRIKRTLFAFDSTTIQLTANSLEVMGQHVISSNRDVAGDEQKVMGQHLKRPYNRKKIRIISDEKIKLTVTNTARVYPQELRLVTAEVEVKKKMTLMTFITNNFDWSPVTVCELYRARWGIEVFFKELKQTLQLADFIGYNENAVRWQIWTGLLAYLLLRFISWEKHWKHTFNRLYTLVRSVLLNYFDLTSVIQSCDTMGRRGPKRIRGTPEQAYQMLFDFA